LNALKRILLRDGDITVGVAPEFGAITRFDARVFESVVDVLRPAVDQPHPGPWALGASCFPLVPYGGRLRDGRFQFDGREVRFPLNALPERHSSHGDAWTRPWSLTHLDRRSACMSLSPERRAPLQYQCTQMIGVTPSDVRITMTLRNVDSHRIPVGIGLHPYFARRAGAILKAHLPLRWQWDQELMPLERTGNPDAGALLLGKAVVELPMVAEYDGWDGHASIEWPAHRIRVQLQTAPTMKHAVLWIPEGQDFFCFEPTSHATDALNGRGGLSPGEDFIILEPDQVFEQHIAFSVSTG
jgi:aldose 1-epimerase